MDLKLYRQQQIDRIHEIEQEIDWIRTGNHAFLKRQDLNAEPEDCTSEIIDLFRENIEACRGIIELIDLKLAKE
ncbi:hypothetical protein G6M50_38140 [Agrobacterium rhizogenes]|nr:hypothetical protein [Rhizobium rhizogenes]NTJ83610.1 hypothetical protein [Rhizobium rhizogenes]